MRKEFATHQNEADSRIFQNEVFSILSIHSQKLTILSKVENAFMAFLLLYWIYCLNLFILKVNSNFLKNLYKLHLCLFNYSITSGTKNTISITFQIQNSQNLKCRRRFCNTLMEWDSAILYFRISNFTWWDKENGLAHRKQLIHVLLLSQRSHQNEIDMRLFQLSFFSKFFEDSKIGFLNPI